jgi:ABC-type glutathione transport system ATPase component
LLGHLPPGAAILSGSITRYGRAALIPQEPALALSPFLRAGVQVRDCARDNGTSRPAILDLFARLGLDQPERIERSYPHQLSGGQQQRVAWAQALIQRPALLIADEPTTALDPIRQQELASLITALAREQGCAILWISHDPHLLRALTSRLAVMHEGRFVELGPTAEVLDHPTQPHTRLLCEASR